MYVKKALLSDEADCRYLWKRKKAPDELFRVSGLEVALRLAITLCI